MRPGDLIADRFEVQAALGSGGMGEVYRVLDRGTGERVALKLVSRVAVDDTRFAREAEALAQLRHPGIVRYVDHGDAAAGDRWLAMEWVEGPDLGQRLLDGPLSIEEAIALGRRLADALGHAHERGLVHRDVKPANVILAGSAAAAAKLVDFGIVLRTDASIALTRSGALVGTPAYMSPEQARGERNVDARTDVWALGVVLYECVAGRPPFEGASALAVLSKIVLEDPRPLREVAPHVPPRLAALVTQMLAKDPAARPRDARAVSAALAEVHAGVGGEPPEPRGPTSLTPREMAVLSVVVVSDAVAPAARTLAPGDWARVQRELATAGGALGAEVHALADGSVLLGVGGSDATGQVVRAARVALAARELVPDSAVSVATGRAALAGRLPAGEVIDRAVALLPSAAASVRLDEVTARLLPERFHVRPDAPGFLLLGEHDAVPARRLLGKVTPHVGRKRELRLLEACVDEALDGGRAQVAVVTGPAGMGKSRLVDEVLRRIEARPPLLSRPPLVLRARAEPMRAGSPFAMLAPAVRADLGEPGGVVELEERVGARLAVRPQLAPETRRIAVFLGEMIGMPFPDHALAALRAAREDPRVMADQVRRAFEDWIGAEHAERAVVIVLEDLHWGDLPTIGLVDAALRAHAEAPILVVATGRPELQERHPRLWEERSPLWVRLAELGRDAGRELVRAALGRETPAEIVDALVERAGGNPFFLEELVRTHAESGGTTPGTVLAVVGARLAAFGADERRLLRAASVLGVRFWSGGVRALLGEAAPAVEELLGDLERHEVIVRDGASAIAGEAQWSFRHALVRDAAYELLTPADRALGHRLAARWLAGAGERDPLVLADHYERGGEPAEAAPWYLRAAEAALDANDFDTTLARVARAIACGASGEMLGELKRIEATVRSWHGDAADAMHAAREALVLLPRGGAAWCRAVRECCDVCYRSGAHDELAALGEDLVALAAAGEPEEPSELLREAAGTAAMKLLYAGRDELAARLAVVARRGAETPPRVAVNLHHLETYAATRAGDLQRALQAHLASHRAYVESGDERRAINQLANVAFQWMVLGTYAEAERSFLEVRALAEARGLHFTVHLVDGNLCLVLAHRGRLEEAERTAERAIAGWRKSSDARMEAATRSYLARIVRERGDLDRAVALARSAAEELDHASPPLAPAAFATLADLELARGDARAARIASDRAYELLPLAEEGDALVRIVHHDVLRACGETERAAQVLAEARDRLLATADRITDPALRRAFLEAVPENARTLARTGTPE